LLLRTQTCCFWEWAHIGFRTSKNLENEGTSFLGSFLAMSHVLQWLSLPIIFPWNRPMSGLFTHWLWCASVWRRWDIARKDPRNEVLSFSGFSDVRKFGKWCWILLHPNRDWDFCDIPHFQKCWFTRLVFGNAISSILELFRGYISSFHQRSRKIREPTKGTDR
jgi:hypothetical protein